MLELFKALDFPKSPRVKFYPQGFAEGLGDNPEIHRWRAMWDTQYVQDKNGFQSAEAVGIALCAHPVAKRTPCGAWIDKTPMTRMARWEDADAEYKWDISQDKTCRRWVSDTGNAAWAKPTQEEALHSLVIRLSRWGVRLASDVNRFLAATESAEMLLPRGDHIAKSARENFKMDTMAKLK